ncbi:ATP-binding protein [Spirosoma sp. SC4-14]|uniref:sensor histidine kinase n=1 Tax=Spirosoma sp. SC4-14 TaxID=3128900 RepID=UPI0030CDADE3
MKTFLSILTWSMLLICLIGTVHAYGQIGSEKIGNGMPPIRVYLPDQYDGHSQNFAITQDHRGVLYIGNFAGVIEYDGLTWRTIPTENTTKVSALLTASTGRIYVGANGEFGYLRPDSTGKLGFSSLSQRVSNRFNEIISILETKDGLYFVSRNILFFWNGKKLTEWHTPHDIVSASRIGQSIYVFQRQKGLSQVKQGRFVPVQQQGSVPTLYDMPVILPLSSNRSLLITSNQGLFQLANNTVEPFASSANTYLATNQATSGAILNDHTIAIGTVRGGIVRLSTEGQLDQIIPAAGGLNDQLINAMFADREGNLWLALNNGIAELEIPSPITLFSEATRLTGEVMDIRRVNGTIYMATINGLFKIENSIVRPVDQLNISCFSIAEAKGSLFVATSKGLYRLTNGQATALTRTYTLSLAASKTYPDRLYAGTESGFDIIVLSGQQATIHPVPALNERIFGVVEDQSGNVWLETLRAGLYKFSAATNELKQYTTIQGLPTLLYNRVATTSQGLLVYNEKGIYRLDPQLDRFSLYNPFHTQAPGSAFWKNELLEDEHGDLWTIEGDKKRVTLFKKRAQRFIPITMPFLPISTSPINVIYPDEQGLVWFGGRDGIVRYNANVHKSYAVPYQTLIRQIQTTGEKTLFDGYTRADTANTLDTTLAYKTNDISFEFSAAVYPVTNALTFQYILENYDKTWSDWTTENKKEYTNLPPGTYRFRVKARNIYDLPSREATYRFRVLPPWYARWWFISFALVVIGLLGYWLVRWRLNALVREKQELETLIKERTEEVVFQKVELEKQSEELAVKNDQLEKIDLIVKSINAEIDSENLFQTILSKFSVIRNMETASFLVYDKPSNSFRFQALRSSRDISHVESVQLTLEEVESRLLLGATEDYEDIYRKDNVRFEPLNSPIDDLPQPRSLITIVIKNEGRIEGFITLENTTRTHAFDQRDLTMIRNLKEHLIAAFIKTRLLEDLENTLNDLKNTQDELIRQEKLASVGQLTKGIVDRILNPLNYVNNFSQLSDGLIDDLLDILEQQKDVLPADALDDLLDETGVLKSNLIKIQEHSNSTTRILKDMQRLLKEKSRDFLETDLNSFLESKARSAIQESKAHYKDFVVDLQLNLENKPIKIRLLPYEFGQVVQNMVSNSYYALHEKSKSNQAFKPAIHIATQTEAGQVHIRFHDNGKGIPSREVEKIFSPFFTTKPTSEGSGLGLFMVKDIIEIHKGKIEINSKEGEFTEILITLPTLFD